MKRTDCGFVVCPRLLSMPPILTDFGLRAVRKCESCVRRSLRKDRGVAHDPGKAARVRTFQSSRRLPFGPLNSRPCRRLQDLFLRLTPPRWRNWQTRQLEVLVEVKFLGGSSPLLGTFLSHVRTFSVFRGRKADICFILIRRSLFLSVLTACTAKHVRAQEQDRLPDAVPSDCLVYLRYDPAGFTSDQDRANLSLLPLVARLSGRSGAADAQVLSFLDAAAAAATASSHPQTLCIRSLNEDEASQSVRDPRVILTIDADLPGQAALIGALEPVIARLEVGAKRSREEFELSRGVTGQRIEGADWTVEWLTMATGQVTLGLGRDVLKGWTDHLNANTDQGFITRHRAALQPAGERFLEVWVNLDELRSSLPRMTTSGRLRDVLVAWKLDNARNWLLTGRWTGIESAGGSEHLQLDITWQRRSDEADVVVHRSLTQTAWPPDLKFAPPKGTWIAVFPADVAGLVDGGLAAWASNLPSDESDRFDERVISWRRRMRSLLPGVTDAFEPWVVVTDHPKSELPIPGAATVLLQLKDGLTPARVAGQIERVVESFSGVSPPERRQPSIRDRSPRPNEESPEPEGEPKDGEGVVPPESQASRELVPGRLFSDSRNRLYWLVWPDLPAPLGTIACPAWGFATVNRETNVLVVSWSPDAVKVSREVLQRRR